jgi:hypothetical protein
MHGNEYLLKRMIEPEHVVMFEFIGPEDELSVEKIEAY